MFTLQDDIFRASKAGQPSYADVSARVDAYYEDFDKVFVDGFDIPEGKEKEAEEMFRRAAQLVQDVSGERWAWPHYEHIRTPVLDAVEQRYTASQARFSQDMIGLKHTPSLIKARRQYADSVARAFLEYQANPPHDEGDASLWPVFASRAKVMLSPLTPEMGLWPLPTKKTMQQIHKGISPFEIGINEVSIISPI